MAHQPRNHQAHNHANGWASFFISFVRTPRRAGITLVVACSLFVFVNPVGAAIVLNYFLHHVVFPLLPVVILIGMAGWVFRVALNPFRTKKKKNDH